MKLLHRHGTCPSPSSRNHAQQARRRWSARNGVTLAAIETGVENAHIEGAGARRRIAANQRVRNSAAVPKLRPCKVTPISGRSKVCAFRASKMCNPSGQSSLQRDLVLGIMVAAHNVSGDACAPEARDLAREEQSSRVITPVAVEHIARNDQEGGAFLDRSRDKRPKSATRGGCEQAPERTVDVQIGGVDEAE